MLSMTGLERRTVLDGLRVTSVGTLASRVLGMVRDMATASLLGLSSGGVMDTFVVAFRIPNLFRAVFGEGALVASYLPALSAELEKDRTAAWRLASATLTWLAIVLAGLVLIGEAICGAAWLASGSAPDARLLAGLSSVMLPYLLFICLAAQAAATLNALGHFSVPALAPAILNLCWLAGAWFVAPWFAPDKESQAYVLAWAILVAGMLQFAVQWPMLRRLGFRFEYDFAASRTAFWRIVRAMAPVTLGLTVTRLNTLMDSLMAWGLAAAPGAGERIAWLGYAVRYPLTQGAAAAIYYGERLYQFPVGILGLALATAIFPLLSRHAARGDRQQLGADLTFGLRMVLFLALPASAGLMLLAEPLARLFFERGQFTPDDTVRAGRMIACYASGVWAYCALPVVVRGYYALGDLTTPVKVGVGAVALNFGLNLVLIWPLAEAGLAVATSISAGLQVVVLLAIFSRRLAPIEWPLLARSAWRTALATLAMAAAGNAVLGATWPASNLAGKLAQVSLPVAAGMAVYFAAAWLLGGGELKTIFSRT
ncbi:MAG: murein biosynthesis integral membrane protein MurJ [Pirellulales bacterium]